MNPVLFLVPAAGALALVYAAWRANWVERQDAGSEVMREISERIREGAMAFLNREYRVLAVFVAVVAVLLALSGMGEGQSPLIALSFVVGAVASALAGFLGMRVATRANVRTTASSSKMTT